VSVGMPNGPNAEWFFGRNAERAECRTPVCRMPKRNKYRQTNCATII